MPQFPRDSKLTRWIRIRTNLPPVFTLLYLLIALGVFIFTLGLAVGWLDRPFTGAFTGQTLLVIDVEPSQLGSWNLDNAVDAAGFQVTGVDGVPARSSKQFEAALADNKPGDAVLINLQSPGGQEQEIGILLQDFPFIDQVYFLYAPYLVGLFFLLSGFWVFGLYRREEVGRVFTLFAASGSIVLGALFDLYTTHRLVYLWTASLAVGSAALIHLSFIFPGEIQLVKDKPYFRWMGYLPALIIAVAAAPLLYNMERPRAYLALWQVVFLYALAAILIFILLTVYRRVKSTFPIVREQARMILVGTAFSLLPVSAWFALHAVQPELVFPTYLLLFLAIFPVFTAYAMLRYRLLKTDYLASRAILYGLLIIMITAGYALFVSGFTLLFGSQISAANPFVMGALVFLIALGVLPLRNWMQARIDAGFSKGMLAHREKLQAFSRELTEATELPEIISSLRRYITTTLNPSQLHVFVYDALSDQYEAAAGDDGRSTTDLRFSAGSALVKTLDNRRAAFFLGESKTLPTALQNEKARLALLGSDIYIPLPGRDRLIGWTAVGLRSSGEPYNDQDMRYLESLNDQSALAIERAQVVANLERRVHEMNVLARVSQGINVTVVFDDILELIYAQTNQVIPTVDFRITLFDSTSRYLYHVFYLEQDDRLAARENSPLPSNQGLESEVLNARQPLITDDYERECRNRAVAPDIQGVLAWASVPLNAGAETIGVLSLGSRSPSAVYTQDQVHLLQAIADQAAGAIVKASLLQESERRTRQLTSLNEVARSLTSTLDLDRLLNQILNSAQDLLNCEAGSLLLIDKQTDELIFKVVTGPVAESLAGTRLPPGTGLVGKVVQTREPVIANDVRHVKEWFDQPDELTGFTTENLLAVPIQIKDAVIGVIEVINRKDGMPFSRDDQELLAAFTSQAAVAIENARLYTLTDQALNDRVEELSVMQRIDRELNASLNVDRALKITLNWAMRQSNANAGLIAIVEERKPRVMASQGYPGEFIATLSPDVEQVKNAIENGQMQRIERSETGYGFGYLPEAQSKVIVPIRRESETIGLILLESLLQEAVSDEVLAFLSRLSDHASIAIANARLYAEVEAANLAKSDFVSFVSHELKTPMTSIKGFTDLLVSGVVGPVNDTQQNFLQTIRSNVERMVTLVSDLADVSRIEAGRLRLDFKAVPVQDIVSDVTRSINSQVEEKGQELVTQLAGNLPPMWGDRTRLIQILTNLVSNAHKYSPEEGKITICAEVAPNRWDDNGPPKVLHISVQDTGIGISEEDQKKIFQKFFRADDQQVRDVPGTGLGLNITKQLVEMQGGKIWFITSFRQGTTFHFTVPAAETA